MSKIPEKVSSSIRKQLWKQADEAGWMTLTSSEKTKYYEQWSTARGVGDVLGAYFDGRSVRVYIKDVLMKPYARARLENAAHVFTLLKLPNPDNCRECYVKPHGRLLNDGKMIAWGTAKDWKAIILAVFERAYRAKAQPFGVVLIHAEGRMRQPFERKLVEDAARRLGISNVVWGEASPAQRKQQSEPTLL